MNKYKSNLNENKVTAESIFKSRRELLKIAGFITIFPKSLKGSSNEFKSLKNKKFVNDFGGLTSEKLITNYNNFYEFSQDK